MADKTIDARVKHGEEKDFVTSGDYRSVAGSMDCLHCCPSVQQCQDGTLMNRLAMASFAVVLLWLSSLAIAVSLVGYVIASPTVESVHSTCTYAYDVTVDERDAYVSCVDRQLATCQTNFDIAVANSISNVELNFDYNTKLLDSARLTQKACSGATTTLQAALAEWPEGGTDHELYYACGSSDPSLCSAQCSLDEDDDAPAACTCDVVRGMIGDISSVRSAAFAQAVEYKDYSVSTVSALAQYASDRAAYDSAYVYNKTEGARNAMRRALEAVSLPHIKTMNITFGDVFVDADQLMGCVSLRNAVNFTGCYSNLESARDAYQEVRDALDAQLKKARDGFREFAEEADEFVDNVADAFDNMRTFYEGFQSWLDTASIDTSDLGDWFGLSLTDFLAEPPTWPSSVGILTNTPIIPGADYMWDQVDEVFVDFIDNVTIASVGTVKLAEDWYAEIDTYTVNAPELSPDDYNPPQYEDYATDGSTNTTEAQQNHEEASDEFIAEEAVALNAFAELEEEEGDDFSFDPFNFTLGDDAYNYVVNTYFPFEPLSPSEVEFDVWMLSLTHLANLLIIFDYVYRAYRSIYIFARFWSRSGLQIPDVDMRVDRDNAKTLFQSNTQLLFQFITSPLVWGAIFLGFFGMFVVYVCQIYIPIYNTYVDGCVRGTTNGTFLTSNLYSIAYNYAAEDGNEDYFNGIEDYNVGKTDVCAAYATSTQEQQNEDQLFLNSLTTSQRNTRDDMYLMAQCIDTTTMDDLFLKACCGQSPYDACSAYGNDDEWFNSTWICPKDEYTGVPFDPPSTYMAVEACQQPADWGEWELRDAVFYCADIPDCALTCSGPSKEILRTVTEQCGCMVEWLVHSSWFKFTIAACIYLLMNASRIMLNRALCKVFWQYLSPGIFTYKATCDNYGNVLAPRGTEKFESFTGPNGALKDRLDWTLRRYVRTAWIEIIFALGLNLPWIFFLRLASHNIQYDPNAQS